VNRRGFLGALGAALLAPRVVGVGYATPLPPAKLETFVVITPGDGIRDDGPRIQEAIDRLAGGGTICFAQGTYRISVPLVVWKPLSMRGAKFTR
jgi:hypothetical protein